MNNILRVLFKPTGKGKYAVFECTVKRIAKGQYDCREKGRRVGTIDGNYITGQLRYFPEMEAFAAGLRAASKAA